MSYTKLPNSDNRTRRNFHIHDNIYKINKLTCKNNGLSIAVLVEYLLTTVNKKTIESAKKYLASLKERV